MTSFWVQKCLRLAESSGHGVRDDAWKEMCIPSASFSGTEDKDNVDEESDNEVLLIKERNSLSG